MTKSPGPSALNFACEVIGHDLRAMMQDFLAGLARTGLIYDRSWTSERSAGTSEASFWKEIDRLARQTVKADAMAGFIQFDLSGGAFADAQFFADWDMQGLLQFGLHKASVIDEPGRGMPRFQAQCLGFLHGIFATQRVYSAELTAVGGIGSGLPDVALVTTHSPIAVTNAAEVNERYDDPAAFWNAGWTIAAEHGGQRLLTRELDLIAGPEYLARILPHQWAMARAAKAEETGYSDPEVLPEEEAIFHGGAARLHFVGHDPATRLADYACTLTEGQHVQGWEVFALRQIVRSGQMPRGEPVDTVRIVFAERWMAESEKRPLLDIGCHVCVQTGTGDLEHVTG